MQAEYGRPAPAFFCRLLLPRLEQPFFGKQQPSLSSSHHAEEPDQLPASIHLRKGGAAKSTEKQASMYPKASAEKYDMMSPNSQACVIACAEGVTKVLKVRMATREATE